MSDSSIKDGFSAVNVEGKIDNEDLARQMADKGDAMRNEYKKIMPDLTNKEIEEAIASPAGKAGEAVFKKETGTEYSEAVKEAQEEARREINGEVLKVKGEIKSTDEVFAKKDGA